MAVFGTAITWTRNNRMHFEILVEDKSGKIALDILVPKILGDKHTFRIFPYKGLGHIPKGLRSKHDSRKRLLLDQLPKILKGYGAGYPASYPVAVIIVCDLDDKCLKTFRQELFNVLNACNPKPETRFCIAVEEGEAWLLGDIAAVKSAYPKAKDAVLQTYVNDSICGTWERLADAVYNGGSSKLAAKGGQAIGEEKALWAENIARHMDVNNNKSPSFAYFRQKLLELVD